jgi:hypothetical protein
MLVRFDEPRNDQLLEPGKAEEKWSLRRTFLFILVFGILAWSVILLLIYLVLA